MNIGFRFGLGMCLTAALTLAGCGDDGGGGQTTLSGTSAGDGSATDPTSAGPGGSSNATTTNSTDPTADTGSGTDPTDPTADTGMGCAMPPLADGADCVEDCDCESGSCFFVTGFGGRCGECQTDADCDMGGCTPPNPLADPPVGAVCNMGAAGEGCETSDVCQEGLVCGTIIDADPILVVSTCGQCATDADCMGGQLCSPFIDVANFSGEKQCVDPASVPNGQGCDHLGTGNDACESGICYVVNLQNILQVGVCGECGVDADCDAGAGETCMDPDIDLDTGTVIPPMCAAP